MRGAAAMVVIATLGLAAATPPPAAQVGGDRPPVIRAPPAQPMPARDAEADRRAERELALQQRMLWATIAQPPIGLAGFVGLGVTVI